MGRGQVPHPGGCGAALVLVERDRLASGAHQQAQIEESSSASDREKLQERVAKLAGELPKKDAPAGGHDHGGDIGGMDF